MSHPPLFQAESFKLTHVAFVEINSLLVGAWETVLKYIKIK